MMKHAKLSPGTGGSQNPANTGSRFTFVKKLNLTSSKTIATDKENSTCRRSFSMDFALMNRMDQASPSKFSLTKMVSRERLPLEDQDPNSQDSGYSNGSSIFSDDSKSSTNFRFAEPNGLAPRRTFPGEFSPGRVNTSPMTKRNSISPSYRQRFRFRMTNDSISSDFSDDGFGDNLDMVSDGTLLLLEKDENTQLPAGFSSLMSGQIRNLSKLSKSPSTSAEDDSFLRSSLRSLHENITPKRASVSFRTSTSESEYNELILMDKDVLKRVAAEKESGFSIKRRKSSPKLKAAFGTEKTNIAFSRSWSMSTQTSTSITSTRGTLFSYGFKKNVILQRSQSETQASIKKAVQRAISDPELIGDYSKAFILPSTMANCGNTRMAYLECDTLAKLIRGEFNDIVGSYTIIDCRFPYEFEGGHIRGAVNIHTEEQMNIELKENKLIQKSNNADSSDKRDILIFHCEFSSKRGPSMVKYVRNEDRNKYFDQYPKLDYPEIYLLQGGYCKFYKQYKELCDPSGYCPMR